MLKIRDATHKDITVKLKVFETLILPNGLHNAQTHPHTLDLQFL